MSSKERREREREEVRTKILDAARTLFVAHGYEAVTMRKIANQIDYTATALYKHFKDKESLLRELCEADFRKLSGAFERLTKVADPIERLRRLGTSYVDFGIEYPNHYQLMFMTRHPARGQLETSDRQGNPDQDAYAFLKVTVAEGRQAGRFRDDFENDDLLAQVVWSAVHGVVALHLTKGHDSWLEWRPVKQTAAAVVDVMIRGLLKDGGRGDGGSGAEDPAA